MNEWWRSAVIYQIYPRSFQDTTGNGIGDLPGITRRLDHVASLGVDAIWLSPFFTSPQKDMGYDISDHCGVDPLFGTLEDFDALVTRAHDLGLKVTIDQVPSHTSDQHAWFEESRQSKDNPKADWYVWADAHPDGTPPNNWLSVFGGPAWTWEPRRRQYYLHSFLSTQPQMNFHNPEVPQAILDAMRFWLDRGVDGFRLDSINYPFHDVELRDNPPLPEASEDDWANPYNVQIHVYDKTRPETVGFLQQVRALLDEYEGRTSVGEVGEGRGAGKIMGEYTKGGNRLHMAYSFEMLGPVFTAEHFRRCVEGFFRDAPDGWPCWAFSNHDVIRHATRFADPGADTDALARQCIALLLSFEGAVCIYQGEECGQTETELTYDEIVDPPGLKFWPDYKGRDGCRTPMVWDKDAAHGGFTTGTPWLPVKPAQAARAVELQDDAEDSVLDYYRGILGWRKGAAPLLRGTTEFHDIDEPILAFTRADGDDALTCVFNLSPEDVALKLDCETSLTGPARNAGLGEDQLELGPNGFAWLTGRVECARLD
ncbi:alpha-glucosidase family protein [Anianabacter salinae]|uniref:alpha-glucosidase family protein n=1 Tax=Anianabacter salinae TaxID=2851023 RepID=UPI00225E0AA2|nr:alpha-glucosidase family protein [Anianabacter salinae]MBV0912371.1 alpha-glucosidase family protein [Anianabacter salinae]